MKCSWCGSHRGVRPVRQNGLPLPSPVAGVPLHLCWDCWGWLKETGQRRDLRPRAPADGPITGIPLTPAVLRQMGR